MRSSEIIKRPVVTLDGEDVAEVKDIVYSANGGQIGGFTLNGRGFFSGPLKTSLAWRSVLALGPDAVIVESENSFTDTQEVLADAASADGGRPGDILGSDVITDDGAELGRVIDVIVAVSDRPGEEADVVGYEIAPDAKTGASNKMLIPLPDTLAASGEHLIVPAAARNFVSHDLSGFGAAVEAYRSQHGGEQRTEHGRHGSE